VAGHYAWEARDGATIDSEASRRAIAQARRELDEGLYRSRWERSTAVQRRFMAAMAVDQGRPSAMADLVARMGRRRQSDLSIPRRDLIKAGHVYVPERGYVAFTVPGMDGFVRRHPDT
jgi:hypothetical protein